MEGDLVDGVLAGRKDGGNLGGRVRRLFLRRRRDCFRSDGVGRVDGGLFGMRRIGLRGGHRGVCLPVHGLRRLMGLCLVMGMDDE